MTSQLAVLVGMVVTDALKVHDYVQLLFEQDIVLNIYNELRLCHGDDLRALNGATLLRVEEKPAQLLLSFSQGTRLDIDRGDDASHGPEALALHVPGYPTMVWNSKERPVSREIDMGDMGVIAAEGSPCTRAKEVPTAQGTSTTLTRSFQTLCFRHNGSKGVRLFAAS